MGFRDSFYLPLKHWEKENYSRSAANNQFNIELQQHGVNPEPLYGSI